MNNLFSILIYLVFIIFFTSCSNSQNSLPKGIYKLVGLWELKTENNTIYERWRVNPDSTLQGEDYYVDSKGDTVFTEYLKIITKGDSAYYVATVPGQNDGKPVYFNMIEWTAIVFSFENRKHDFPQLIRYYIKTQDMYTVTLEGPEEGNKIKSIELKYTRISF